MCFVKICQQCGKEFTTKRYPTQFCSPRCYNQHKRTELNKRKLQLIKQYDSHIDVLLEDGKLRYIKQCDHCGKEFKAPDRPAGSAAPNVMTIMTERRSRNTTKSSQVKKDIRYSRVSSCL